MAIMQRYDGVVQDASGNTVAGAVVIVTLRATGDHALIYSDEGTELRTNPLTTSNDGRFHFYAADGDYTIVANYGGVTDTLGDVTLRATTHSYAEKAIDEVVNSNLFQSDDDLFFYLQPDEMWYVEFLLYVTTTLAADFKLRISTAASGYRHDIAIDGNGTSILFNQRAPLSGNFILVYTVAPTRRPVEVRCYATADSSGGYLRLQWSQNTTVPGDDTKVEEGSYLKAVRVA